MLENFLLKLLIQTVSLFASIENNDNIDKFSSAEIRKILTNNTKLYLRITNKMF